MSRRTCMKCTLVAFGLSLGSAVLAMNTYWSVAGPGGDPWGEVVFFGAEVPPIPGKLLWYTVRPLLICSGLTTLMFAWLAWTAKRPGGLCPRCGYDVRATPDVCPECGASLTRPKVR